MFKFLFGVFLWVLIGFGLSSWPQKIKQLKDSKIVKQSKGAEKIMWVLEQGVSVLKNSSKDLMSGSDIDLLGSGSVSSGHSLSGTVNEFK